MEKVNPVEKRESTPKEVERTHDRPTYVPATDIYQKEQNIVIMADMPGVDENSVHIHVEKNILTITGHTVPVIPEGFHLRYAEYQPGVYERSFSLADDIDLDKIEAAMKNGVLSVILPKAEQTQPRTITVKVEK